MFSAVALCIRDLYTPGICHTHKIRLYTCQLLKQPAQTGRNSNVTTFWFSLPNGKEKDLSADSTGKITKTIPSVFEKRRFSKAHETGKELSSLMLDCVRWVLQSKPTRRSRGLAGTREPTLPVLEADRPEMAVLLHCGRLQHHHLKLWLFFRIIVVRLLLWPLL